MTYLHTGVRSAELRKMKWLQVDFTRRTITVGKSKTRVRVVGKAGFEPATPGLEGRCSIQLSYSPTVLF